MYENTYIQHRFTEEALKPDLQDGSGSAAGHGVAVEILTPLLE